MEIIGKPPIHPVLFYSGKIAGYFTWTVMTLSLLDMSWLSINSSTVTRCLSYATGIAGLVFIVFSLISLGASTRLGLPEESTTFKTNGIYRISRNPMYLGFNLWTVSAMLYTLSLWIILAGVYSIIVYHLIILGEEQFLAGRFGGKYTSYKLKTRRYV